MKRGTIEHKDSMGNIETLPAGEFQLMSAGSGVTHSEYNPSVSEPLEFLQIWIEPAVLGIEPGYQQKRFDTQAGMQLIVSPDGRDGTLKIHQDAYMYQLILDEGQTASYSPAASRTVYVHAVSGTLQVNDLELHAGDGATVKAVDLVKFLGQTHSEALVFDLV